MSNIFPEMAQTFSKEVEDRANAYFEQIYNQPPNPTMSIDEVLAMLKSFKDSHEKFKRVGHGASGWGMNNFVWLGYMINCQNFFNSKSVLKIISVRTLLEVKKYLMK